MNPVRPAIVDESMNNGWFFTYVILSEKDGKFYTGTTGDLNKRIEYHNKGLVVSTKYRLPVKLIYFEACLSKEDAFRRERYLKTGMGKRYLKNHLFNSLKPLNKEEK